jgi:alkylation response protein AidB-like acyl-CoA dehydrogenase
LNFDFSPEQQALRDQVRRLFADGRMRARKMVESGQRHDDSLWAQLVELGGSAAAIPEGQGGIGLGALELCVIAEEAGRSLAPIPFMSSAVYASEAVKLAGGVLADEILPRLAEGAVEGTVAFAETDGSWDSLPGARVEDGLLYGVKDAVVDPGAGIAVVSARAAADGEGFGWWLVDLSSVGVEREVISALDIVRRYARLRFAGVPARRLGAPGAGAGMTARLMDTAAIVTAFEQIGGAEAQLARCVDYAKVRKAFGGPIGVFQGVKHRLADMYVKIELARGHALYGAWALSTDAAELSVAAAGARIAATEAFSFAAEEAIEMHGGIGFTWEDDCHLYYRRARLLALELGSRRRWVGRLLAALAAKALPEAASEIAHGL